jgi:ATP-binding cassette subfamily B protein
MKAQQTYSALSEAVQETFAGIRVIKSFVKEDYFIKKFADTNDDYRRANMEIVRIYGAFFPFVSFLAGLTSIIVIFAGGREVVLGRMSPGSLVALFSYLQMLIWPMLGMGFTVNMLQRGAVSLKRVNEVMNTEPSIKNSDAPVVAASGEPPKDGSPHFIELRSMSFAYETDKPVLHTISLAIEQGSVLGVMGRTGSGKSTLVKTLCRSIDPPAGTIFIRGVDVRDWDLESLRKLFAMTPQDSYLFSASIKSNIAYGNDDADDASIQKAIETAALNRDIETFGDGLDTLIGERGLTLSGGQKQRTAIARALLLDAEILVLDDSLSACDAETETKIIENVKSSRAGKTTIIVSHRISAFRYADNVVVLDEGRVAEYGPPALLAKRGGFYAKMAELQAASLSESGAL